MGGKHSSEDAAAVAELGKFSQQAFVVGDHCPPHQPIVDLGDSAVYYTDDHKLKHRTQYRHYYFRPQMKHLIETTDPQSSKALLYVKPGPAVQRRLEGQRLYFVSKTSAQAARDDAQQKPAQPVAAAPELDLAYFGEERLAALAGSAALSAVAASARRGADGTAEAEASECALCATTAMIDPLMSECKHVCCNDCWLTWLDETGDTGGSCPDCDLPVRNVSPCSTRETCVVCRCVCLSVCVCTLCVSVCVCVCVCLCACTL
jgi:hypothetical protein